MKKGSYQILVLASMGLFAFSFTINLQIANASEMSEWRNYEISINGNTYNIRYQIQSNPILANQTIDGGATTINALHSVTADVDQSRLLLKTNSPVDISMTVELPRSVIQALSQRGTSTGDGDIPYSVMVDNEKSFFEERTTGNLARTLEIPFIANGERNIQIIGTWVVPEFNAISLIMLATAMLLGFMITKWSRNNWYNFMRDRK